MYSLPAMVAFGIIACSMPEVFADYPQRHLLATSWALCFRKIYVCHIIIFVLDQIMNAKIRLFSVSAKFSSIFRNLYGGFAYVTRVAFRRNALRRKGISEATKTTVQLPFSLHIRVNNIQGRENQTKTPGKWGKKRLRIFP